MITVNSASGAEALAVGCPVINVRVTDLDLSPFVETTGAVPEAHNAEQLREVLDDTLSRPVNSTHLAEVIKGVFYKLDGRAKQRVAEALAEVYYA
jgi:hypothetical protein